MRATDIIRHRRVRSRRANSRGDRILRAAAAAILLALLALLLVPGAGLAVGAAGLLAFLRDLPDVQVLEQLPARFQASTATTYLYAWDEPDSEGLRYPVLIDEIVDPRLDGAGWAYFENLPASAGDAFLAAAGDQFPASTPPSLAPMLAGWWRTGVIAEANSPITDELILKHLRADAADRPGDPRRDWQDWLLGRQIDGRYSRAQQLEWVLNTSYYGHLAYGIEAAARVYFGKNAADLTVGEAALLAVAARNPATNPFDDLDAARREQAAVLAAMAAAGTISVEEATTASDAPVTLAPPPGSDSAAPDFARLARRELEALLGPERLLTAGAQVETTLDLVLQSQVHCVIAASAGQGPGSSGGPPCPAATSLDPPAGRDTLAEIAVVALDPSTGAIIALAGGAAGELSHPIGTLAQPLIYLTALSQGYNAAALTMDVPSIYLQDGRPYSPRNADDQFLGPLRLREALVAGRAVPTVQVLSWVGIDQVLATARALGLAADKGDVDQNLTFAGRGFPATLLDLGRAFAAIGNGGTLAGVETGAALPRPATIRRVVDPGGREIYTYEPATRDILSAEMAFLLSDMLADREAGCPTPGCSDSLELPDGHRAAAVTGESDAGDSWAIGYTPDRLIGVWAGGDRAPESSPPAAPIRQALLAWSSTRTPVAEWSRPAGLRAVEVCEISGLLPSRAGDCPTLTEWFIPGTEPAKVDTMVREVAINRETGRLATAFTPPQLVERRTYIDYPPEAAAWAEDAGFEPPPTEYDTIRRIPTRSGAAELNVEPWSVVSGQWSVAGSAGGLDFAYFRLAYFPGLLPEAMQTLVARSATPVESAELGLWDTTLVENGLYTILLTVVRADGTFDEVAVPVMVANDDR